MNPDDLINIFYSGFSGGISWQVIDDLARAINQGAIIYGSSPICTKESFHQCTQAISVIDGLGPQEKGHMALKETAKQWLSDEFKMGCLFEYYIVGLHPDVISEDGRYVIEYGTTDPSCVRIFLREPSIEWIGNISYPYHEDKMLFIHKFARGENFSTWDQESIDRARDAFHRFHRRKSDAAKG